jgi:hypothetical protein
MINTKSVLLQAPNWSLYRKGDGAFNRPMKSVKEIRRINLKEAIDRKFGGVSSELAKKLGWESPSLIYAYISGRKDIGDKLARKFENAAGLEKFRLDEATGASALTMLESQLLMMFRRLDADAQELLLGRAQSLFLEQFPQTIQAPEVSGTRYGKLAAHKRRKKV